MMLDSAGAFASVGSGHKKGDKIMTKTWDGREWDCAVKGCCFHKGICCVCKKVQEKKSY